MTSELCRENALRQWRASLKRKDLSDEDRVVGAIEAYERQLLDLNTRAVPDVPELVRYGLAFGQMHKASQIVRGEYVRYDQAADVIAAKDEEIERLREALREVHTMIEYDRTGKLKSAKNVINAALSAKETS